MDLDNAIIDYEREVLIGMNEIYIEPGSRLPVRRAHIARDPIAYYDRIVLCRVIELKKHELTGDMGIKIEADGFSRSPYISILQVEREWDEPDNGEASTPPVVDYSFNISTENDNR